MVNEFLGEGDRDDLDPAEFFTPRDVFVVGGYKKFEISIAEPGDQVNLTTKGGRDRMTVNTVKALIEALQDSVDFIEEHPPMRKGNGHVVIIGD